MSVLDKLATSLNRRDEIPNQELAKQIGVEYTAHIAEEGCKGDQGTH